MSARALSYLSDDEHLTGMATVSLSEARGKALRKATAALALRRGHSAQLAARDVAPPAGIATEGAALLSLYEAFLVRLARGALQLLPSPHLEFDLAAYWVNETAARLVSPAAVAELLSTGAVLLPPILPPALLAMARHEAAEYLGEGGGSHLGEGGNPLPGSALESHTRSLWLVSPDAPPGAPRPARPPKP